MILAAIDGEGEDHGDRNLRCVARDARAHAVGEGAHRRVPGHGLGPRAHGGVRGVEARQVMRYCLLAAGCLALWRVLIWLSWGLWAVTR